jgi:hypothetical protein
MLGRSGVPVDLDQGRLVAVLVEVGVVGEQVGLVGPDEFFVFAA